jgi:hypothetical protein
MHNPLLQTAVLECHRCCLAIWDRTFWCNGQKWRSTAPVSRSACPPELVRLPVSDMALECRLKSAPLAWCEHSELNITGCCIDAAINCRQQFLLHLTSESALALLNPELVHQLKSVGKSAMHHFGRDTSKI